MTERGRRLSRSPRRRFHSGRRQAARDLAQMRSETGDVDTASDQRQTGHPQSERRRSSQPRSRRPTQGRLRRHRLPRTSRGHRARPTFGRRVVHEVAVHGMPEPCGTHKFQAHDWPLAWRRASLRRKRQLWNDQKAPTSKPTATSRRITSAITPSTSKLPEPVARARSVKASPRPDQLRFEAAFEVRVDRMLVGIGATTGGPDRCRSVVEGVVPIDPVG